MEPPTIQLISDLLQQTQGPAHVFAVLQFNDNLVWYRDAWSTPGDGVGPYSHNHAERFLEDDFQQYISEWTGGPITKAAITIKYSPCPECSRQHLSEIGIALRAMNVFDRALYYLEEYRGLGDFDSREGRIIAGNYFGVGSYGSYRREWATVRNGFRAQLGI